jgi:hypothetical protein
LVYRLQLDTDEIRCPSGRAQVFRIAEAWIERQRVVRAFVLARDRGFEYVVVRFADGPDGEPPRFYHRVVLTGADGTASVALTQDFPARRGGSTASDVLGAPLPQAVRASCVDYAAR